MNGTLCLIDSKYVVDVDKIRPLSAAEAQRPELAGMKVCAAHFAVPYSQQVRSPLDPSKMSVQPGLIFHFNPIYLAPSSLEYLKADDVYPAVYWQNVEKAEEQFRMQKAGISVAQ